MGDFPWMTERGTFVINGTERVVVTQLVRSPGAYLMEPKDREKQVFIANLMPRPRLVARARDRQEGQGLRPHRPQAQAAGDGAAARDGLREPTRRSSRLFDNSLYIRNTIESDTEITRTEEGALIELFKKQRPGEPPSVDNAQGAAQPALLRPQALRPDARRALQAQLAPRPRHRHRHAARSPTRTSSRSCASSSRCPSASACPRTARSRSRTTPPRRSSMPREPVAEHLDEYEHFGNRRLRTVGELIQEAFRIGLYRMERVVRERLTTEDADTITPQTIINIRPVVAALKEFFGSSQLSPVHGPDQLARRADPPPPPVRARRRRADARARADRGARRAPDPLRAHVPDRDARGSEHRPDRLAVLVRRGLRVRLRHDALPGRQGRRRHRGGRPPRRHPGRGAA